MAILDIGFEWHVASAGYTLRKRETENILLASRHHHPTPIKIAEIVPLSNENRKISPLLLNRELYLRFAELPNDPKNFVDFANSWGFLTSVGQDEQAEQIGTWSYHVQDMAAAVLLAKTNPRGLAKIEPESALVARLVDAGQARPSLRITPRSLITALQLQLFEAVSLGSELANCDRCGKWFQRGVGTGRGRKARFCSDACRFDFHNARRSKGGSR